MENELFTAQELKDLRETAIKAREKLVKANRDWQRLIDYIDMSRVSDDPKIKAEIIRIRKVIYENSRLGN